MKPMKNIIYIRDIQQRMAQGVPQGTIDENIVRRLWWAALETLQEDIFNQMSFSKGLWLASPLPALYQSKLLDQLQGWVWAPDELETLQWPQTGLLPSTNVDSINDKNASVLGRFRRLPLREGDGQDPLLIIITPEVQVALALEGKPDQRNLLFRSDQETFRELLKMLDQRLLHESPENSLELRNALADLGQLQSNSSLEKVFWPLLSQKLASSAPSIELHPLPDRNFSQQQKTSQAISEITLLEALTHEVRTPLATIRTLIRSILRQKDLSEIVINRLNQIDSECNEQIDRFGLIFNAAELQRQKPEESRLASTNLGRMLKMLHPSWKQQLSRRGIKLNIDITPDLPEVLSDSEKLESILGGLIDRTSRGLQPGGVLSLELRPAGPRLKLQIFSEVSSEQDNYSSPHLGNADIGPVLSWNSNTGSLQLSRIATQRLLASLGGRLAHRRDSALTVFFPIAEVKD